MKSADISKRKKKLFLKNLILTYGIISFACDRTGISRRAYYRWFKNDPDFKTQFEEISECALDFVELKLLRNIQNGDTKAIIFYLKTKGKKRGYVESIVSEVPVNHFLEIMKRASIVDEGVQNTAGKSAMAREEM